MDDGEAGGEGGGGHSLYSRNGTSSFTSTSTSSSSTTSTLRKRNRLVDLVGVSESTEEKIRNLDLFPKPSAHVVEHTWTGTLVSLITALFIAFLLISELVFFLQTHRKDTLSIDTSVAGQLDIYFNITFPQVQCGDLAVDTVDAAGEQQLNVHHQMFKAAVDYRGFIIGASRRQEKIVQDNIKGKYDPAKDPSHPKFCGSCHAASGGWLRQRSQRCCNTCDDVIHAYAAKGLPPPNKQEIEQCFNEIAQSNPGCNIAGRLIVKRVTGNFHFAPGRSFIQAHENHMHHVHEYNPRIVRRFNASHIIHQLHFGEDVRHIKHPLDGTSKIVDKNHSFFKYFIKVVPTVYRKGNRKPIHTNQISVTQNRVDFNAHDTVSVIPGVFFVYDLNPIQIEYQDNHMSFAHFIVNLCAVIGGIFTVNGYIGKFIEYLFGVVKNSTSPSSRRRKGGYSILSS